MHRILIIAAHPDDDILGCGGIINKYKNICEFKVIFIAEGSTCRFEDPNSFEAQQDVQKRNSMGVKALQYLGINNFNFYNFPCGRLDQTPQITINKIIENTIKEFKPDTVFTHTDIDSNKDHHKVYDATIIATRPGSGVDRVYSYEVLSSTEWGFKQSFTPNVFFALEKEDVLAKWESLKFYESEIKSFPYPRSKEGILSLARFRGMQSGNNFAESFQLIRENK
jgi:LmbE family N-acetylglucosaminyl deacetylase